MRAVLIANRGEIAVRIARACADAGLRSVAVYADDDADGFHVRYADDAYALHGVGARSYLDIDALLRVARESGADAVHPGYGFLSENADFAQRVIDAGLIWIGPPPAAIRALGDKVTARKIAEQAGTPMVAGTKDPVAGAAEVHEFGNRYGFPVAIKAVFGGGGRGMKVARSADEVDELYDAAVREAVGAFGRGECFVERYVDRPRHVEVQVLADTYGDVLIVGTRDCSLQRRHQKLVEEAPAPFVTVEQERALYEGARAICKQASYVGAGTVEFLLGADGTVSFLEVNTRLQVEHPVTEETSDIDLVRSQFLIAEGGRIPVTEDPAPRRHAIEFRINAEDPARGFLPATGTVTTLTTPGGPGVRVDAGIGEGTVVGPAYDSLLAKLIVTGRDRTEALSRARRALAEFTIGGVATVLPFHRAVVQDPAFTAADGQFGVFTRWIETEFAAEIPAAETFSDAGATGAINRIDVEIDGRRVSLGLPANFFQALSGVAGAPIPNGEPPVETAPPDETALLSPTFGTIVAWHVDDGDEVAVGDPVLSVEAMKMETVINAHRAGRISGRTAEVGAAVQADSVLTRIQ